MKVKQRKGFTLVELAVVIAIIAVLVAIAIPVISGVTKNAKDSAMMANIHTVETSLNVALAQMESEGKKLIESTDSTDPGASVSFNSAIHTLGDSSIASYPPVNKPYAKALALKTVDTAGKDSPFAYSITFQWNRSQIKGKAKFTIFYFPDKNNLNSYCVYEENNIVYSCIKY